MVRRVPQPLHREQDNLIRADPFYPVGDRGDDQRIGEERQVITMLLHGAERQYEDSFAQSGKAGPMGVR